MRLLHYLNGGTLSPFPSEPEHFVLVQREMENTNSPPYSNNLTAFMRALLESAQWAPARGRLRIQNMPFVLAAGTFGARCAVRECRAAGLAGRELPLQQRETHTV